MSRIPSRLLTVAKINDLPVSFFTPPHDEPDFPWVSVRDLVVALEGDEETADRFVRHTWNFNEKNDVYTTAKDGDRIVTIIPHVMAQGIAGAFDEKNGFVATEDEDAGPCHWAYCIAAGRTAVDHWPLSFQEMFAALENCGGPYMAALRA
ncbi:hypothetical protein ACQKGC_08350 [Allorhizobium pseudoryzae]|uniref:hypothetical protein n=1 Tax=Allorhizobium pseudoryzae TaxID=379684 RepID=UPI003CFCD520